MTETTHAVLVVPCSVVGNVIEVTLRFKVGSALAVPDSATVCAVVLALDKTLNVAVSEPTATGLKETNAVQLAAGARVAAQLFNSAKDVRFVPASEMLFMVNVAAVLFVMVTEWALRSCAYIGRSKRDAYGRDC